MNRHHEIIRSFSTWRKKKIDIATLKGGMTNDSYIVTVGKKKYVVRFAPETGSIIGLDRKREIYNYNMAYKQGIGPRIFKHYPKHSALIVEHLEGVPLTKKEARKPKAIKAIAKILLKLHNGKKLKGTRISLQRGYDHVNLTKKYHGWLPKDMAWYLKKIKLVEKHLSPISKTDSCHEDLMFSNIIKLKNGGYKLIDWEYSGNDDRHFDLAMFSVKGSFGKKEDSVLTKTYSPKDSKNLYNRLQYTKVVVYFVEAAYGILQNTISKKRGIDYKKYALDNLAGFKKQINRLSL